MSAAVITTLPKISKPPLPNPAAELFGLLVLPAEDEVEVAVVTSSTIAPPRYQLPISVNFPSPSNIVTFQPTLLADALKDPKYEYRSTVVSLSKNASDWLKNASVAGMGEYGSANSVIQSGIPGYLNEKD